MPWGSGGKLVTESVGQTRLVKGRFAGGGAAGNCSRAANTGMGIANVIYNGATGAYQIQLNSSFARLDAISLQVGAGGNTTSQCIATYQPSSVNANAGTINIFISDVATPTAHDLTAVEELAIIVLLHGEGIYTP